MAHSTAPKVSLSRALAEALSDSILFGCSHTLTAPAKINLRLKILGRREDGYHVLSMLNASTSFSDEVSVTLVRDLRKSLLVEPEGFVPGRISDNLAIKAWDAFWQFFGFDSAPCGVQIEIRKRIPLGGGLGGGSSDAAAVLRFLANTFRSRLVQQGVSSIDEFEMIMNRVALRVGADVPYAYTGGFCWVSGIGEIVRKLPMASIWNGGVLVTIPPASVPTADFYQFYRQRHPVIQCSDDDVMRFFVQAGCTGAVTDLIYNDFEPDIIEFQPLVGKALSLARMIFPHTTSVTGSGSAIFSLVPLGMEDRIDDFEDTMMANDMVVHRGSF